MNNGIVYGIGVGPGDSELITLKAIKIIKKEKNIFIPKSGKFEGGLIRNIVQKYINPDFQNIVEIDYFGVMNYRGEKWKKVAEKIHSYISIGQNVVYLTLGDPMVYSTFIYLVEELRKIDEGIKILTVPGISSFALGCSEFGIPLVKGEELATICYGGVNKENLKMILNSADTVVIMKIGKKLKKIMDVLKEEHLLDKSYMLKRAGLDGEYKIDGLENLEIEKLPSDFGNLSTIIIRRNS